MVMTCIAAGLLVIGLGFLAHAVLARPKRRDPHHGMAQGCLMLVAAPLAVMLVVLGISAGLGWETGVRWIYWMTVVPAGWIAAQLVVSAYLEWAKKRK
jgi:hypothetical protein